jgi:hypothetical protein
MVILLDSDEVVITKYSDRVELCTYYPGLPGTNTRGGVKWECIFGEDYNAPRETSWGFNGCYYTTHGPNGPTAYMQHQPNKNRPDIGLLLSELRSKQFELKNQNQVINYLLTLPVSYQS